MAFFGNRERRDEPAAAPSSDPAPREVEMLERDKNRPQLDETSATTAFLGKGTRVSGKVSFEEPARLEGQIEGEITAQGMLIVGESAEVKAQITGTSIIVHGQVTGDIAARSKIELHATSRVIGNVTTPSLVIHEGATFEGQCSMGAAESARRGKKPDFSVLLGANEPAASATTAAPPRAAKETRPPA
jgi:cytoskeletal protein CcmA (bactofilin family)